MPRSHDAVLHVQAPSELDPLLSASWSSDQGSAGNGRDDCSVDPQVRSSNDGVYQSEARRTAEARFLRKLDSRLLPVIVVIYIMNIIDVSHVPSLHWSNNEPSSLSAAINRSRKIGGPRGRLTFIRFPSQLSYAKNPLTVNRCAVCYSAGCLLHLVLPSADSFEHGE